MEKMKPEKLHEYFDLPTVPDFIKRNLLMSVLINN